MSTPIKTVAVAWFCFTLVLIAIGLHIALGVVPPDASQGNVGRILYYHLPNWIAMSFCFLESRGVHCLSGDSRPKSIHCPAGGCPSRFQPPR
jgi:hypothetical protein